MVADGRLGTNQGRGKRQSPKSATLLSAGFQKTVLKGFERF
jgi:hypothetical protein